MTSIRLFACAVVRPRSAFRLPSGSRSLAALASILVSAAACQKAEFDSPAPQALIVSISSGVVSADDGTLTVTVEAVEDGAPVLNEEITATIGGACAAAPQTVPTDESSGVAVFDFTGLDAAGACTVTATTIDLPPVVVNFQVVPGTPVTIALASVGSTTITAGEFVTYTVFVYDSAANVVPIGVDIATDAPGATVNGDGTVDFTVVGSWQVFALVVGFPGLAGTADFGVTVSPGNTTQVVASADLTLVEAGTGTLTVTCTELDAFGNVAGTQLALPAGFTTNAPGAVLAEPSANVFTATGITAKGNFNATCVSGAASDLETFAVGDSIPPTEEAFTVTGGTGPYAAGTIVTVNLDVQDVIAVASESLVVVSGPGEIVSPSTLFETTANPPSRSFQVRLDGSSGVTSTVTVQGQAADSTGNLRATSTLAITVAPAPTLTTAMVSTANVEAGSTLVVTCNETNALTGSSANTNFAAADVTTTAVGEAIVEQGANPNNFDVTGLLTKGTFVATCAGVSDSGDANFAVVDTTPPTQDGFSVSGGTGPYAAGTTVTVNLDVQDLVGVASESLVIVSGPGVITSPATILETTANPASRTFQVRLEGTVGIASTVSVRGQAADSTGNLFTTSTIAISVNPAPTVTNALLSTASVEAGSTLVVTCNETNAVTGSSSNTNFAAADVTTTAVGETIVEQGANPNNFDVTGLVTKGTFVATCAGVGDSGDAAFSVVDTTPPTQDGFSVTGGTGPYAAGTTVIINFDVQDIVGVGSETLVVVSGPGVITSPATIIENTPNPPSRSFQVRLDGTIGSASTVTVRGQATDSTGNLYVTNTLDITVNAAGTIVTAEVSSANVEAGSTLVVTCDEVHAVTGSSADTNFAAVDVTTTAVGETITEQGPAPNNFDVMGLVTKGTFIATCDGISDTGDATFAVVDTTPPAQDGFSVTGGTGPYAAGTTVTVNLDVQDIVGVASESLVVVSGPGVITSPSTVLETTANPPSRTFQVRLEGTVGSSSTVTIRGQAADTTGNVVTTNTIDISVNAAGTVTTAILSTSSVEAGSVLVVTCNETNAVTGSSANTNFANANVTTTAVGESIAETTPTSNVFNVSNLLTKGTFIATCAGVGDNGDASFAVVDTTSPAITQTQIVAATGPEGVQTDARYAAGTTLTLHVSATDAVGISRLDVQVVGSGTATPATFFPAAGTTAIASQPFSVLITAGTATFSQVTVRVQATDTTGNTAQATDILLTVDPAKAIDVAPGVTMITVFETTNPADGSPIAVAVNAFNEIYVARSEPVSPGVDDIIRTASNTAFVTVESDFVPAAADLASGGFLFVDAGYGSPTAFNLFYTLLSTTGQIGALDAGNNAIVFSAAPVEPTDAAFGNVGGTSLFCLDLDQGNPSVIRRIGADGSSTNVYTDAGAIIGNEVTLAAGDGFLWVPLSDGKVARISSAGATDTTLVDFAVPLSPLDALVAGATPTILVASTNGTVYRATTAGTELAPVSAFFDTPVGLAQGPSSFVYVLDRNDNSGTPWRVYRLSGL